MVNGFLIFFSVLIVMGFLFIRTKKKIFRALNSGQPVRPDFASHHIIQMSRFCGLLFYNGDCWLAKTWIAPAWKGAPLKITESLYLQSVEKYIDFVMVITPVALAVLAFATPHFSQAITLEILFLGLFGFALMLLASVVITLIHRQVLKETVHAN
jgi:hypothetical protein